MINLLTNAIKYSFESSAIEIYAGPRNGHVEVSVKDHGRGIDENILPVYLTVTLKCPARRKDRGRD